MQIDRIIVATDLSSGSRLALPLVAGLAHRWTAPVTLLHADELAGTDFRDSENVRRYLDEAARARDTELNTLSERLNALGVTARMVTRHGHAWRAICTEAAKQPNTLVVMTRHGSHGPGELLGSSTKKVLRHTETPVLVVHDPVSYEPHTDTQPSTPRRLLVGVDLSRDSADGLRRAQSLASQLGAELNVTHVWAAPRWGMDPSGGVLGEARAVAVEELEEEASKRVDQWLAGLGLGSVPHTVVRADTAAEGLVQEALRVDADLIVTPSHGKGAIESVLIGSTTERLVELSPLPVLVLPRPWLRES